MSQQTIRPPGGQRHRHRQRAVAGEGAHLHQAARVEDPDQQPEEEALIRTDLHRGARMRLRLLPQSFLHLGAW
jgi:hypothetical protein